MNRNTFLSRVAFHQESADEDNHRQPRNELTDTHYNKGKVYPYSSKRQNERNGRNTRTLLNQYCNPMKGA